jgi:hypothetical protein
VRAALKCESEINLAEILVWDLHRDEFWRTAGILDAFDGVFGGEFAHDQGKLAVGCGLNRGSINALHVLRSAGTHALNFDKELCVHHVFSMLLSYFESLTF